MLIPHDFLPGFRFSHLKHIQHGDGYEKYPPKIYVGTKNGGSDGHSVAESAAVCACFKSGAWEICRTGGPRWVFRARALNDNR